MVAAKMSLPSALEPVVYFLCCVHAVCKCHPAAIDFFISLSQPLSLAVEVDRLVGGIHEPLLKGPQPGRAWLGAFSLTKASTMTALTTNEARERRDTRMS